MAAKDRRRVALPPALAALGTLGSAALLFGLLGHNPLVVAASIIDGAIGSSFGLTESFVRATPILFCALATALPAWVGLTSIGAEGQFHLGAIGAAVAALAWPSAPGYVLLPLMMAAAVVAGGLWGAAPGALRARWGVNETIITLLMNFLAVLLLQYLVHGPLRDPASFNWPYSPVFPSAATLPTLDGTRLHLGLAIALTLLAAAAAIRRHTSIGFSMKVIEDNEAVARLVPIRVDAFYFWMLVAGGALAALAGMAEVSAIQGRLRPEISADYGYNGFLVAWLAGHRPVAILIASLLVGALLVGVDNLQVQLRLPYSTVNMLLGLSFIWALVANQANRHYEGRR